MAGAPKLYTLPEVAEMVGLEYRTLHSWVVRGLVKPTYPAQGIGRPARLTEDDLALVDVLARLRAAGCDLGILACAVFEWGRRKGTKLRINLGTVEIVIPVVGHRRRSA